MNGQVFFMFTVVENSGHNGHCIIARGGSYEHAHEKSLSLRRTIFSR